MDKRLHSPLPQESDLGITKNYRNIILTAIAAIAQRLLL